jgi:putative nucleotidyltransferase with HDIG domain
MRAPPGLAVRTLAVTFVTVAVILSVVFIVLTLDARERVRTAEIEQLRVSEAVFRGLEDRHQRSQLGFLATLAENSTVKAALDTIATESAFGTLAPDQVETLRLTVTTEARKLAALTAADVLAVLDTRGRIFASAGRASDFWKIGDTVEIADIAQPTFRGVAELQGVAFGVSGAALSLGDARTDTSARDVGRLVLATSLDDSYARELATLAGTEIVVARRGTVMASTVPKAVTTELMAKGAGTGRTQTLDGEEYAVSVLSSSDDARIYALSSIDEATRAATRSALVALGTIALGSFVLAGIGSLWLARTLTDPINRLSGEIATMTAARAFGTTLEPTGTSREVDALATAFNELMRGLLKAEGETRAAYLGAIRALAAALDARDPYTAGHSERVSALSVLIAREMNLPEADVDIIRLGALLHDIGKIGVPDAVLRKPGALTPEEFEQIKRHPALGARILRQVPFLAPHLPIVELHHERPDGSGYPFGLRGDAIPLAARVVHVADAFDAITSARAYRPARAPVLAIEQLRRGSGPEFDPASVDALCIALPWAAASESQLQELLGRGI